MEWVKTFKIARDKHIMIAFQESRKIIILHHKTTR